MKVNITFTTNDTVSNMGTVSAIIVDVAQQNGGQEIGSGLGPEGRDISLEFPINSEVKRFLRQLRPALSRLILRIPSLKVTHTTTE